jgi:hypothetical protein
MDKIEYFIKAILAGMYKKQNWTISVFALTHEGPKDWEADPYPWRVVRTPTGISFVSPETGKLVPITGIDPTKPLINHREVITITPEHAVNLTVPELLTTTGNFFYNHLVLIHSFGAKFPYVNNRKDGNIGKIEKAFTKVLEDDVPEGQESPTAVYVKDKLRFDKAVLSSRAFTQLFCPALTEKAITAPPGIVEFRNSLLKQHAGRLSDPTIIAMINAELVKFDGNNLKGDPSENFLLGSKARETVRRKLFLMTGAEPGLEDKATLDLIPTSLSEGWDVSKFPSMVNTMRSGSYQRGAETMLGGEAVKWLQRASSNLVVVEGDCGSTLGFPTEITDEKAERLLGFHIVGEDKKALILTPENVKSYIGKTVLLRSPQFCIHNLTDYCEVCVGPRLAVNKRALSAAISAYGSTMMYVAMSGAHAKALILQKAHYKQFIK